MWLVTLGHRVHSPPSNFRDLSHPHPLLLLFLPQLSPLPAATTSSTGDIMCDLFKPLSSSSITEDTSRLCARDSAVEKSTQLKRWEACRGLASPSIVCVSVCGVVCVCVCVGGWVGGWVWVGEWVGVGVPVGVGVGVGVDVGVCVVCVCVCVCVCVSVYIHTYVCVYTPLSSLDCP